MEGKSKMYKHHELSIKNMEKHFREHNAIALFLVGSVAKGTEREDSDLDGIVILSEEEYAEKEKHAATTETINGLCTYEGGYFDIKYMTKQYLKDLAEKGSEPARNGFTKVKILFCNDAEIEDILPQITIFQKSEKEDKLLSFYSNFWLNYHYFLKSCAVDGYMKMHTISEVIYSIYRMILQEKEILFDCIRRLEQQVESSQSISDADRFVDKFIEITTYVPPKDIALVLTRYSKDFQEWWREPRPNIKEW